MVKLKDRESYQVPECIESASIEETMLCASFTTSDIVVVDDGGFEWE